MGKEKLEIRKIKSINEKLVLGVNYYTAKQVTWNGIHWVSYNASIGNSSYQCLSLSNLKETIQNYKFETELDRARRERIMRGFGTSH